MWLELDLDTAGDEVRVRARGSRGEQPPPQIIAPEQGLEALETFSSKVARAVRAGKPLEPDVIKRAQALHRELFKDKVRDTLVQLRGEAKTEPVLIRLFLSSPELRAVPWEALCEPETDRGFLGTDPGMPFARGVYSEVPSAPEGRTRSTRGECSRGETTAVGGRRGIDVNQVSASAPASRRRGSDPRSPARAAIARHARARPRARPRSLSPVASPERAP